MPRAPHRPPHCCKPPGPEAAAQPTTGPKGIEDRAKSLAPFKVAYVSAKHALEGLSKVVALEGGPHGVTSNCINPGYVRTPLVEQQIADQARIHGIPEGEVVEKIMLTESAVKRLVAPEEVASLAGWLATDAAGMMTGASLAMDGGWTAR